MNKYWLKPKGVITDLNGNNVGEIYENSIY